MTHSPTLSAATPGLTLAQSGGGSPAVSRPLLTGTRPSGSMRDHDRLCVALKDYEGAPVGMRGYEARELREAAGLCGWTGGPEQSLTEWAVRRVENYCRLMGGVGRDIDRAVRTFDDDTLEALISEDNALQWRLAGSINNERRA